MDCNCDPQMVGLLPSFSHYLPLCTIINHYELLLLTVNHYWPLFAIIYEPLWPTGVKQFTELDGNFLSIYLSIYLSSSRLYVHMYSAYLLKLICVYIYIYIKCLYVHDMCMCIYIYICMRVDMYVLYVYYWYVAWWPRIVASLLRCQKKNVNSLWLRERKCISVSYV